MHVGVSACAAVRVMYIECMYTLKIPFVLTARPFRNKGRPYRKASRLIGCGCVAGELGDIVRTLCNLFPSLWTSILFFFFFLLPPLFGPVRPLLTVGWRVDQTAVVLQIIFRTRCKAPDLINYNSVRVITALQDSWRYNRSARVAVNKLQTHNR